MLTIEGKSFTGITFIVTTPTPEVHVPSETVNVNESSPLKFKSGVYTTWFELIPPIIDPLPGLEIEYVKESSLGSVASNNMVIEPSSSFIDTVW